MTDCNTIIGHQIVQFAEEFPVILFADMFKHANRHNPIEFLREFAVILQTKPNVVG